MTYTRRRFLEATGALAAAAGLGCPVDSLKQSTAGKTPAGAPGVELNVDGTALPDYSRDLERYLVRLSNDARERRKRVINAVSTRQDVLDMTSSSHSRRIFKRFPVELGAPVGPLASR